MWEYAHVDANVVAWHTLTVASLSTGHIHRIDGTSTAFQVGRRFSCRRLVTAKHTSTV
jgi:hypothetical protein